MSEKLGLNGRQLAIFIVTCITGFFAPTFGSANVITAMLPDAFGVTPAQASWIGTIGNVTSPIAGFIAGVIVGSKVSYRWTGILMTLGVAVFGALPFLYQDISWPMLLGSRMIFGFCMGFFNTWANSIMVRMAKNESVRATMLGINSFMFSIGGAVGNMAIGALALKSWQNGFLFYGFCIIATIACIILVRDEYIVNGGEAAAAEGEEAAPAVEKLSFGEQAKSIPGVAWGFIISFMICTCACSGWFGYIAFAMVVSGANTLLIGTVMTAFTIAGAVIALVTGALWKAFRSFTYPLSYIFMFVAMILALIGFRTGSTAVFFASAIALGIGVCWNGVSMTMINSVLIAPAAVTLALGCMEVFRNFGSFLATPWLLLIGKLFGDNPNSQFMGLIFLTCLAVVIGFILAIAGRKRINAGVAAKEAAAEEEAAA